MKINTINKLLYVLVDDNGHQAGRLEYKDAGFEEADLETDVLFRIKRMATGLWCTSAGENGKTPKVINSIRVEAGGLMTIVQFYRRKKYAFKKPVGWKPRFAVVNTANDELIVLIPAVNWKKEAHDYVLQLNEDFEEECDPFLILQAVHCANCSLSMMTGGPVPALINI